MTTRRIGLALIAFALSLPRPAVADESDDALARGVALRRERRDAAALAEFQRAYALKQTPRGLAQVALAEAALGKWVAAETDLARALISDDEWIARQRDALQVALGEIQGHLGALDVSSAQGTEVWIDGELAGHTPVVALRIAEGHRVVELRAPGMSTSRQEMDVRAGETAHVEAALVPAPAAAPQPAAPPAETADPEKMRAKAAAARTRRQFAWGTAGGAVLFAAGGGAATAWAATSAAKYNDNAQCDRAGLGVRSVQCASVASQVKTAEALEVVGYGAAGAAALASVILFATSQQGEAATNAKVPCIPSVGGVWCAFEF
jgi:hypothetical protein